MLIATGERRRTRWIDRDTMRPGVRGKGPTRYIPRLLARGPTEKAVTEWVEKPAIERRLPVASRPKPLF